MAPNKSEKLPVAANLDVIQARIDLAISKRDAIVKSWVDKYDTSRCAPSKSKEEIEAWDAELFNPVPSNLGLGATIPKNYLDGDVNRKDITGNGRLRSLMLGKKGSLQAAKPRDAEEKASSMKRGLREDTSDEDEGRSNLGRSKKPKHEVATTAKHPTTQLRQPTNQTKPLPLQQKAATSSDFHAGDLSDDDDDVDSGTASHASKFESKFHNAMHIQTSNVQIEVTARPPISSEPLDKSLSEAEARRQKNRLKKEKKKERKRKEKGKCQY